MINNIKDKRILYLTTRLYEYPQKIADSIKKLGGNLVMVFFNEKSIASTFLLNSNIKLYNKYRIRQEKSILHELKNVSFDFVLVQHPYWLSFSFFSELKRYNKKAKFINYNWDSLKTGNYLQYANFFDKILSFDIKDVKNNSNIEYLPLFFTDEFKKIRNDSDFVFDIGFVGTIGISADRYEFVNKLLNEYKRSGIKSITYFFINRNKYYKTVLLKQTKYNNIKFKSLKLKDISEIYRKVKVIIDYNNPLQSGLTMRTFEVLGAGRKLITTNMNIINEPFYNNKYIDVVDAINPKINLQFLDSEYLPESDIIDNYYIDNWVKNIFS